MCLEINCLLPEGPGISAGLRKLTLHCFGFEDEHGEWFIQNSCPLHQLRLPVQNHNDLAGCMAREVSQCAITHPGIAVSRSPAPDALCARCGV